MKKLLALMLAITMVSGLAACSGNKNSPNTSQTSTEQTQQQTEDKAVEPSKTEQSTEEKAEEPAEQEQTQPEEAAYDPFGRFDETVHITQTRILATWMGFDEGEDEDNNWWTRTYKEQLNVELTNLFTAPNWGPDFDTKINIALATDDLPDVMSLCSTLCVKAIEGGKVMDMNEIFDKYASPQIKAMSEADPFTRKAWSVDGKMYGLASPAGISDWTCFWIPKSMIDELNGGTLPTSFADIEALAMKIKDKTGSHAIGLDNTLGMLEALTYMHHGTYSWIDINGKLEFGKLQPEAKAAWAKAAEWYQNGLLAQDFASKTTDDIDADFSNSKLGIVVGGENLPNGSTGRNWIQLHNDDDLMFVPIMAADGKQMTKTVSAGYDGCIMISSKCENPEAVMKLMNLSVAISNDYGKPDFITDAEYNTTKGGNMGFWNRMCTGWEMTDHAGKMKLNQMVREMLLSGSDGQELRDMNAFSAVESFDRITSWLNEGVNGQDYDLNWSLWKMELGGPDNKGSAVNRELMNTTGRFNKSPKWSPETEAEAANNQNMYAKYIEFATRAIMENNVDQLFQEWTDYYYKNGGQDIYDQVNAWYDTVK